ncbi:MAG: TspO/MBR family protein [Pseudomonadota bacterium]
MTISWSLFAFFGLCFVAALSGSVFRPGEWYRQLNKPSWNPPDWLFPVAWTALFAMMAISAWLVYRQAGLQGAGLLALSAWLAQLALNALWSAIFFGARRMDLALIEVAALWLAIVWTIVLFWPISTLAGALMLPYLAWVSFAAFLNWTLLRINRSTATSVPNDA